MNLIRLFIVVLFLNTGCFSQNVKNDTTYQYLLVDEVPRFGEKGLDLFKYLYDDIYSKLPKNFGGTDKVLASFVVDTNGEINDVNIIKSYTNICEDAVKNALSTMPKLKPGKLDGKFVRVRLFIELVFKLE